MPTNKNKIPKDIQQLIEEIKQIDTTLGNREVEILVLTELTDYSLQEIADILDIKKGTVASHKYTEIDKSIQKVLNTIEVLDQLRERKGEELNALK